MNFLVSKKNYLKNSLKVKKELGFNTNGICVKS